MILVLMRNSLKWYTIRIIYLIFMHNCCSNKILSEVILTNLECFSFIIHFPLFLSECAGKILLSIPTNTTWACSFHKNSCIIINSMQKYQQVLYAQHIHVCTTYTYTVYIFATFNLCTD